MTDPLEFNIGSAYELADYIDQFHSDDRKARCAYAHFGAALDYYNDCVSEGDVPHMAEAAKELLRYYDELLKSIGQRDDDRSILALIVRRW